MNKKFYEGVLIYTSSFLVLCSLSMFLFSCCNGPRTRHVNVDPETTVFMEGDCCNEPLESKEVVEEIQAEVINPSQFSLVGSSQPDLIITSGINGEELALITVAAFKLNTNKVPVIVPVDSDKQTAATNILLKKVAPQSVLCIASKNSNVYNPGKDIKEISSFKTGDLLSQNSIDIAVRFWESSPEAILVDQEQQAIISGAILAAKKKVPLLVLPEDGVSEFLAECKAITGLEKLVYTGSKVLPESDQVKIETLTEENMFALLNIANVRNIAVASASENYNTESINWIIPYYCLVRNSFPVFAATSDVEEVESSVYTFINKYHLKPATITLFGSENELNTGDIEITPNNDSEDLDTIEMKYEPFTFSAQNALEFGVGRIPYPDFSRAGQLLAGTFIRKNKVVNRALLVANTNPESGNLPLCEVVSMATASEIKNLNIPTSDFYRQSTESTAVRKAAEEASVIIYEGHLNDNYLFGDNDFYDDSNDMDMNEELDMMEYDSDDDSPQPEIGEEAPQLFYHEPEEQEAGIEDERYKVTELLNSPVVVYQSCQSLDEDAFATITGLGGVGLLAATTNVHSASGSSIIKTFVNESLYKKNCTIGEALRDSRNYFFCLQDLKNLRNHKQQAKSMRVALCFRYWGDPEEQLFPNLTHDYEKEAVTASVSRDGITINYPKKRLVTAENDRYFYKVFPGSNAAGIVKSYKRSSRKRIYSIQFFDLDASVIPNPEKINFLVTAENDSRRAVCRMDYLNNRIYILYFPGKEDSREKHSLSFVYEE